MRRWIKRVVAPLAIAVAVIAAADWSYLRSRTAHQQETYAVLSAFIETRFPASDDTKRKLVVIYDRPTNHNADLRIRNRTMLVFAKMRVASLLDRVHVTRFERRFNLTRRYVFTNDPTYDASDLPEADRDASFGTMTFSNVIFNRDATQAYFYTEYLCGLCGEGEYVMMEKRNGKWAVAQEQATWVS